MDSIIDFIKTLDMQQPNGTIESMFHKKLSEESKLGILSLDSAINFCLTNLNSVALKVLLDWCATSPALDPKLIDNLLKYDQHTFYAMKQKMATITLLFDYDFMISTEQINRVMCCAVQANDISLASALIKRANINFVTGDDNMSLLMLAVKNNFIGLVSLLTSHPDIDVHMLNSGRRTACHYVRSITTLKCLIKCGADLNATTPISEKSTMLLSILARIDSVKLTDYVLLKCQQVKIPEDIFQYHHMCSVHIKTLIIAAEKRGIVITDDINGYHALSICLRGNDRETFRYLLKLGIDPTKVFNGEHSILDKIIEGYHSNELFLPIVYEIIPDKLKDSKTALSVALKLKDHTLKLIPISNIAASIPDSRYTLFHYASINNRIFLRYLISCGIRSCLSSVADESTSVVHTTCLACDNICCSECSRKRDYAEHSYHCGTQGCKNYLCRLCVSSVHIFDYMGFYSGDNSYIDKNLIYCKHCVLLKEREPQFQAKIFNNQKTKKLTDCKVYFL